LTINYFMRGFWTVYTIFNSANGLQNQIKWHYIQILNVWKDWRVLRLVSTKPTYLSMNFKISHLYDEDTLQQLKLEDCVTLESKWKLQEHHRFMY
jgi:hypothetical protein